MAAMTMAGIINSQLAPMAITTTIPIRARLTDITVRNGSTTASFSVSVHGMAGAGAEDGIAAAGVETAGVVETVGAAEMVGAVGTAGAAGTAGVVVTAGVGMDVVGMDEAATDEAATDTAVAGFMPAAAIAVGSTEVVSVAVMAVASMVAAVASMVAAVATVAAVVMVEGDTGSFCRNGTVRSFPDSAAVSSKLAAALFSGELLHPSYLPAIDENLLATALLTMWPTRCKIV